HLHTADPTELEEFLRQPAGQSQDEFIPFILDVQNFDHPDSIDLGGMISLFVRYGMQILRLQHISDT
ncbi:septum site-determining protein MinC, partial [Neisseria sp. P0022.S002]